MHSDGAIRVIVVDGSDSIRYGLTTGLTSYDDIAVVGEACDGTAAVVHCRELEPDVVVMDITMPTMDGLQACREIRENYPKTQVILLCNFIYELPHEHLVEADARYMFSKTVSLKDLHAAVRSCAVAVSHE